MRDFNFPDISLESHSAVIGRFGKSLKFVGDNFWSQVLRELTRKDALLDVLVVNGKGLVRCVMVRWLSWPQ